MSRGLPHRLTLSKVISLSVIIFLLVGKGLLAMSIDDDGSEAKAGKDDEEETVLNNKDSPGAQPAPGSDHVDINAPAEAGRALKKGTTLPTRHGKCDFVGKVAIRDQCARYVQCSRRGTNPSITQCGGGKFFDHKKRICTRKSEAECTTSLVCPREGIKYPDGHNRAGYLECVDGVPYPRRCYNKKKYNERIKGCI